jgi:hypothetical protein
MTEEGLRSVLNDVIKNAPPFKQGACSHHLEFDFWSGLFSVASLIEVSSERWRAEHPKSIANWDAHERYAP